MKVHDASTVSGGRPVHEKVPLFSNVLNYFCPTCGTGTSHSFLLAKEFDDLAIDMWRCRKCGDLDYRISSK